MSSCNDTTNTPKLELDLIVFQNKSSDDEVIEMKEDGELMNDEDELDDLVDVEGSKAKLILIRMVNRIPLLDSAEAHACGIVRGLTSMDNIWNSFGLDISVKTTTTTGSSTKSTHHKDDNLAMQQLHIPTYDLKDSFQVSTNDKEYYLDEKKNRFLPAGLRIGNMLLIVQIHAQPCALPLPTLSKVRQFTFIYTVTIFLIVI